MKNHIEYPVVPKDFVTAPIFASKPQEGPREIILKDKKYVVGGFKPISEDRPACPALDIRHGRALFTILSFVKAYEDDGVVRFSINEFCKRFADSNGGRYSRDIKAILSDLERCWFRILYDNGDSESYRILKNVSVHIKAPRKKPQEGKIQQEEIWFDEVELHPKFFGLLKDYMSIAQIHLKTLTSIRSPLAQAIYAYIPSRAIYYGQTKPFEITLKKLLEQVGHTVPEAKSVRKKIFVQNNNPLIKQLDNVEVISGRLRVNLCETVDGDDYKLQFWVEKTTQNQVNEEKSSILKELWINSGRSVEDFNKRMKPPLPVLSSYQLDLLEKSKIKLKGSEVFFRQALAVIGQVKFNELLAEAKGAILEGQKITKSETHRLIYRIKESLL